MSFKADKQSDKQQLVLVIGEALHGIIPSITDVVPVVPNGTSKRRMQDVVERGRTSIHCKGVVEQITVPENGVPHVYRGRVAGFAVPNLSVLVPVYGEVPEGERFDRVIAFKFMSPKNFLKSSKVPDFIKRDIRVIVEMLRLETSL